jgi:mRNA interferase MazF
MWRGEVWWVRFGPRVGGEIQKRRPAVIVSNDVSNRLLNRLQVVPLTTNVSRVYPSEVIIEVAGQPSKAMANQIHTVSKRRVLEQAGVLTASDLESVERAIEVQLGLR